MFRVYLDSLVKKAAGGSNPELYAEYILDNAPEDQVRKFLGQPDALEQLAAINPGVAEHRAWFEALRDATLGMLEAGAPAEDEGEGPLEGAVIPDLTDGGKPAIRSAGADRPESADILGDPS